MRIAKQFGITLQALIDANPCFDLTTSDGLTGPGKVLAIGDVLVIPMPGATLPPPSPCPPTAAASASATTLKSVLNAKSVRTSAAQMVGKIKAAYATTPEAGRLALEDGLVITLAKALDLAKRCQFGEPGDTGKLAESDRAGDCSLLVWWLYSIYRLSGSTPFYDAELATFNYGRSAIIDEYQQNFIELVVSEPGVE